LNQLNALRDVGTHYILPIAPQSRSYQIARNQTDPLWLRPFTSLERPLNG